VDEIADMASIKEAHRRALQDLSDEFSSGNFET
jgi:hypothetical protein